MWEVLEGCPVVADACAILLTVFDVHETALRRDVVELISRLADANLLRVTW